MNKRKKDIVTMLAFFLIILLLFPSALLSYVFTKEAPLVERDKFKLGVGLFEYHKRGIGSVFEIPFVMHLGLAKRVEFIGIFPYIQLKNIRNEPETFGDILLYLKFDMKSFMFHYHPSISKRVVLNQIDLIIGFNSATGPTKEVEKVFSPYSLGLPDFRLGVLYSQIIDNFSLDVDFIYSFASHMGEDYLQFGDSFWSSSKKIYIFGIVNTLVKFLWPGRYPWSDKEAPEWEQYPHLDDFFLWNTGLKYYFEPDWLLFSYDLFLEFNWVKTWSKYSIYPTYFLITPGLQIYISNAISITGGAAFILDYEVYQEGDDLFFDDLYFLGVRFLL
ncbi:MAG: hypothetical protein KKH98_11310 [Spirochaetes bacterium]|nr:hypothetical protein [Spirochaetota bacterium]